MIELMVVIAIMTIMIGIALQGAGSLNATVELDNASKNIDLMIRKAKTQSIGALNDINYGVHFESSKAVIYDATSAYADGAAGNVTYNLPAKIEISEIVLGGGGGSEVIFDRLTGITSNYGHVTARIKADTSKTKTIFINSIGQNSFSDFGISTEPAITNARHVHYNLGWDIAGSTSLILRWYNASDVLILEKSIDTAEFFNADQTVFSWEEKTINEGGINQEFTIVSWLEGGSTVLDVIRYNTEANKLKIYFNKGGEKHIATYENTGSAVTVTVGVYGGTSPDIQ